MANWAKSNARDQAGDILQNCPAPYPAQRQFTSENAVVSSVVNLHPMTSRIEIGALGGQGVAIRWVPSTEVATVSPFASVISSGLGANYDHWIPPGTYREFVVPKETGGAPAGQVGSIYGLYRRLALINKGATAASVIASEF